MVSHKKFQKKSQQKNIKSYIHHTCVNCKCFSETIPLCCSKSINVCNKCNGNKFYEDVIFINEYNKIIKCATTPMAHLFPASVYVSESSIESIGVGVFANKNFVKNEIIEICPFILIENYKSLNFPTINKYVFQFSETDVVMALGYGSLYNHSFVGQNASYVVDPNLKRLMIFYATQDIKQHDELFINYGFMPTNDPYDSNNIINANKINDIQCFALIKQIDKLKI